MTDNAKRLARDAYRETIKTLERRRMSPADAMFLCNTLAGAPPPADPAKAAICAGTIAGYASYMLSLGRIAEEAASTAGRSGNPFFQAG